MSPLTWSGRVRGRPPSGRGTRIRSRTSVICGASPHWPGVSRRAMGRQPPSPARWILQVRPPRDRPSPSSGRWCRGVVLFRDPRLGLAGASRVLMSPAGRGVDADHAPVDPPRKIGFGLHRLQDPVSGAIRRPAAMPLVDRLPGPVAFRQVTPRDTGPDPEQDPVDPRTVIAPPASPPTRRRQMRLQRRPLAMRQILPPHDPTNEHPVGKSHDPPDSA